MFMLPGKVLAQGEGPRVYLPAPAGTNVLSATWMDMKSNMNFAGNIYIPGEKFPVQSMRLITIDIFP